MIDPKQFYALVCKPTLLYLGLYSESAAKLVMGTAVQESGLVYLHQLGNGPARGVYQMEPETFRWLFNSWVHNRAELYDKLASLLGDWRAGQSPETELDGNLYFATAMCRVRYLAVQASLPDARNLSGLAQYWKQYYNTPAGAGTVEQWLNNYNRHLAGIEW